MKRLLVLIFWIVLVTPITISAQSPADTTARRNTIKLDITSYWLYRNAAIVSYERVVKNNPNQTWSITGGFQQFPTLVGTVLDSISVKRESKASGFKLGGEYRFYLAKENKFRAPRGVYIGPYTSFHHYSNGRSLEVNNNGQLEYADLTTKLNILNIGFQIGYQFVINNRWTIDMVFVGPSISNYSLKTTLGGNYTFNPADVTSEVLNALISRYPAFDQLINTGEFDTSGKANYWGYGYRYQLHAGYHFGKKK